MNKIKEWHNETLGEKVVNALKKNFFNAIYLNKAEEAAEYILNNIKEGYRVGFGGSDTIKSLNIQEKIKALGAEILDHNKAGLSSEEKLDIRRAQLLSDVFLCSSNGITLNGELVNVDGTGNRVAAMTFGPKKVIVVVGINKICKDEEAAFDRIKMLAAPLNTKRLELNTPCTATGLCLDCKNESRICRVYSILKKKPTLTDITVLVVGESLGY
jgi:hypothetical protein